MSIDYSDGTKVEENLLELLRKAPSVAASEAIAGPPYPSWPVRYHLSRERSNLVRHLNFEGLSVLEVGAGMGAVSRHIAENAERLEVVEGSQRRFDCLSERLRDLDNWSGRVSNFQEIEVTERFDVVCLLGVLEYAEIYIDSESEEPRAPFKFMIEHCRRFLKEGGVLVVAIENQLGLKYWSGAAEDHTARIFDGLTGYGNAPSARTFSRKEMLGLLDGEGFGQVDEFYPFPDYKLPKSVMSSEFLERYPQVSAELAASAPFENYDHPRSLLYPEPLVMQEVSRAGLLADLSNSFLFLASDSSEARVRYQLLRRCHERGEIAWHYTLSRCIPVRTVFARSGSVTKSALLAAVDSSKRVFELPDNLARWSETSETVHRNPKLRLEILALGYRGDWPGFMTSLTEFLEWSFGHWLVEGEPSLISGDAVDATVANAVRTKEGFTTFDCEWALERPMEKSWFILRNVAAMIPDYSMFERSAPFGTLEDLYAQLCDRTSARHAYRTDIDHELAFQAAVTGLDSSWARSSLEHRMTARFPFSGYALSKRPGSAKNVQRDTPLREAWAWLRGLLN